MLNFTKHLETLNHEPQWFKDNRAAAWEKFTQLPMPTPNEESWRLLDLSAINLETLKVAPHNSKPIAHFQNIDELFSSSRQHLFWGKQINRYITNPAAVIVEAGDSLSVYFSDEITKKGVICTSMSEALTKHGDLLKLFLANSKDDSEPDKLAWFNQAVSQNGIFIYVPDNIVIERPIVCVNMFGIKMSTVALSRLIILVGQNSQAQTISILANNGNEPKQDNKYALVDYLLQAHLKAGAQLGHVEVQSFDDDAFVINNANYCLEKDSRLSSLTAAFGAGQLKDEIRVILKERGAESNLTGLVLGNRNECFNVNTIDDHNAPDTKSTIDFRVALKDEAKSIYHGTIKVAKEAQKTNAFQSNKNLLLGGNAHADSIPKLEILTDDVKCSHGATVGPVDRNQLFYLMSRGLDASKAEELIVNGFFHQLVGDCKIEGVAEWLDTLVSSKLGRGTIETDTSGSTKEPVVATLNVSSKKEAVGARFMEPAVGAKLASPLETK